jgi:ABC-type antimicrobial peptide transport system permease subunit
MAAAGLLIAAAMLGCLLPARQAMRVDPVVALKKRSL